MTTQFPASQEVTLVDRSDFHDLIFQLNHVIRTRRAVFLDRDGTINHDKGYLKKPNEANLIRGAGEAIKQLNDLDLPVIVITNQSALGRGIMKSEDLEKVNQVIWAMLQKSGAYYDRLYFCPIILRFH